MKEANTQVAFPATVRVTTRTTTPLGKRSLLAAAIALALPLAMVPAAPVLAQTESAGQASAGAQSQQAYRFDIPAKPLPQAIADLSAVTGLQVLYTEQSTFDHTAPALQGSYTVRDALQYLLAGSGLVMRFTGGNSVTIELANQGGVQVLPPVKVSATSLKAATEGTGSYTTGSTSTATKMNLSIRETPQSVSVITSQKIEDGNYQTVDEALENATGIYVTQLGSTRWEYVSRGSTIDTIQYDGVSSHIHYYARDIIGDDVMAIYDRVEVVRGATGLTQGAGDPSASINLIRKRPTAEQQTSLNGSASEWGGGRLTFDTSGSLNEDKTVRGRFVSSVSGGDDALEDSSRENQLYYAVLDADLTDSTLLSVGLSHQKNKHDGYSWGGFPTKEDGSFYDLDPEDNMAADWEYLDREENTAYLDLEQALANDWKLKLSGRYSKAQSDMRSSYTWWSGGILTKDIRAYAYDHRARSLGIHANGPLNLLGREHKLVIGANFDNEILSYDGGSGTRIPVDPETWDPSSTDPQDITRGAFSATFDQQQYGVYSALQINPQDRVRVILGIRVSWFDYSTESMQSWGGSESSYEENEYVLPYYGLTYDLSDTFTAYSSYTEIFQPQQNYGISGDLLPPEEGNNKELGVKFESRSGLFNGSVALFETNRDNLATSIDGVSYCNPGFSTCYEAAERVRTRGFEIDASGDITPRWNFSAGYTYSKSEYVEGENKGDLYYTHYIPKHSLKVSTMYRLDGDLNKVSVGASMRAQSEIYKEGTGYRIEQPGYAVFDAMAKYQLTPATRLQLNINNIFDREYYSALNGSGTSYGMFMGDPRNVVLSFRHRF